MKTLNEEMKKIKRLFDYKNGEVITESEDKEPIEDVDSIDED